jgi:hypothetical protein
MHVCHVRLAYTRMSCQAYSWPLRSRYYCTNRSYLAIPSGAKLANIRKDLDGLG